MDKNDFLTLHCLTLKQLCDTDSVEAIVGVPAAEAEAASAGANDRARMERIFNAMTERMDSPLQMRIKSAIGEGDRVAMEMESHGTLKNGRVYNNQYHLLMRIADGRIAEVREYLDTQHVLATWYS